MVLIVKLSSQRGDGMKVFGAALAAIVIPISLLNLLGGIVGAFGLPFLENGHPFSSA
jgi:hypothetical protein